MESLINKRAALAALCIAFFSAISAKALGVDDAVNLAKISIPKTFGIKINIKQTVPDEQVSIMHYILTYTYEDNIHKMRGHTGNKVYVHPDGREAVYDELGHLVSDGYNDGTFNYAKYEKPFAKFSMDILPWLALGQSEWDKTDFEERFFYYLLDLEYGIWSYVHRDDPPAETQTEPQVEQSSASQPAQAADTSGIPLIPYKKLNPFEKQVAHLFSHILFNPSYQIQLTPDTAARMHGDKDFYYSYITQIFDFFGYNEQ